MTSIKCCLVLFLAAIAIVSCIPVPGGHKGHHTHFIIHVPHHIHTVHHTHVKKVHVPVPVVKTVLYKEPPINHGWAHGGWHGSHIGGHGWW
ncbi:hypothetical protein ILUMI_27339 [Ignelater luminosus]|uniref:Uncharacterized protein n=1 Tax=Ignelater luminosus TaxID=2038154 RepID=A0A8K0C5C6_IGNLU|nr:hypothetical protein ILUMI_27339 [Ignelater luminosus]